MKLYAIEVIDKTTKEVCGYLNKGMYSTEISKEPSRQGSFRTQLGAATNLSKKLKLGKTSKDKYKGKTLSLRVITYELKTLGVGEEIKEITL